MHKRLYNADIAWAYECYCEGVSWEWIAKELGIPKIPLQYQVYSAIKNGLYRAKEQYKYRG